jgi:PTH1 family peptidyl-tRNA hydrolase
VSSVSLLVGLGNPGSEYEQTRHNAGFFLVEQIARQNGATFRKELKFHGSVAKVTIGRDNIWLLKPETFMNRSGQAVAAMSRFYNIEPEEILVAHDELDLEPGVARLKLNGGHGGHNGLRDTIAQLGTNNFQRLRIGIGHPGNAKQVSNYVLKKASIEDQIEIDRTIDRIIDVLPLIITGESQKAMNELHTTP